MLCLVIGEAVLHPYLVIYMIMSHVVVNNQSTGQSRATDNFDVPKQKKKEMIKQWTQFVLLYFVRSYKAQCVIGGTSWLCSLSFDP